jgi:cyclase
MFRPRVIPVLLLKGSGLVKTVRFSNPTYIGDPINAVRIFNDLHVDELVFLDINATKEGREISVDLVRQLGDEAYMPFAVGGGIRSVDTISALLRAGAEKVIINSAVGEDLELISRAADSFGAQSIVVSVDVKKNIFGKYQIWTHGGSRKSSKELIEYVHSIEHAGAGEIIITSIDHEGMYKGYDIDLVKKISEAVKIPVVACGGASCLADMHACYSEGKASALAAGSIFVYHGPRRAVLINYPSQKDLINNFNN